MLTTAVFPALEQNEKDIEAARHTIKEAEAGVIKMRKELDK
jgi:hypothetical protein